MLRLNQESIKKIIFMPRESFAKSRFEQEPKKNFLVISNVSGQSFRIIEEAPDGETAIKQIARRLRAENPSTSNLYWNFIKKAQYKELTEQESKNK